MNETGEIEKKHLGYCRVLCPNAQRVGTRISVVQTFLQDCEIRFLLVDLSLRFKQK